MVVLNASQFLKSAPPEPSAPGEASQPEAVGRTRIGELLSVAAGLSEADVQRVLALARERQIRFGDAAVALGCASPEEVLQALSRQFNYAFLPGRAQNVSDELVTLKRPFTLQSEAFRALRRQLLMRAFEDGGDHRAVAIVSRDSGDGKTFFSANMAVALAQLGGRTLIVDADLRGPRQHQIFQVDNSVGLSNCLMGGLGGPGGPVSRCVQATRHAPGLFVLPAGTSPPNPLELVERREFGTLMAELSQRFDHVVVDTPAGAYGADALAIASRCGSVLMLARKDRSRVAGLQELTEALTATRARMVGVVLNEY